MKALLDPNVRSGLTGKKNAVKTRASS